MSEHEGCDGECVTIERWCPECDCKRTMLVVSSTCLECTECQEPIPIKLIKWAVNDGVAREWHLYYGDEYGEPIEEIPWPESFPAYVRGDFLQQQGFLVVMT